MSSMASLDLQTENNKDDQPSQHSKMKTRYYSRIKKRKWEERNNETKDENSASKQICTVPFERVKRKMVAMLLSYSGVNYYGMQRNPGMPTIEEELVKALWKSKYITEDAYNQIQLLNFQRACRTDKGVSAVHQIVSMKMPNEVNIEEINKELPPQIKVFSIKRVTKGFNSKTNCDARTYMYMLPTYAFEDHNIMVVDFKAFRIQSSVIENVNKILKLYLGTKNFHNFTSKKEFLDPSSKRYIISMICGNPFVSNGMEFVIIKVKGQSFMLHQIRKMVGLVIAIARGLANEDVINIACSKQSVKIPMAPSLGLVLEEVHYDRYNTRFGNDGFHERLEWKEVKDVVNVFKNKYILPPIVNTEIEQMSMADWLTTLDYFTFKPEEDSENNQLENKDIENNQVKMEDANSVCHNDNIEKSSETHETSETCRISQESVEK